MRTSLRALARGVGADRLRRVGLREPERNEFDEARFSSGRWASLTVLVDGARHVAIRSSDAGSQRARDGVTVVTGTVTGSGRGYADANAPGRRPRAGAPPK
jgi:hypothetical protein